MARPRPNLTPGELEKRVSDYFTECAAQDVFPDRANMILYLKIPTDLYRQYETNENGGYAQFSEVLKKAQLKREGWLSRIMFSDKNRAQSAVFHLRQPINGGYSEKQEAQGSASVRVKIGDGESDLTE